MQQLDKIKCQLEDLRKSIHQADYRYYVLSDPEVSDEEYDNLFKKLKKIEVQYPQLITSDSPTQRVYDGHLKGFSAIKHKSRMLSLDNTYSIEELRSWEVKIKRILKKDVDIDYIVELKMDGVSAALTYKDGIFLAGGTRGDGEVGEDVSVNLKTIRTVPLKLIGKNQPKLLEVRGEIYIDKNIFLKLNARRQNAGESIFVNPRNAASGALKLLDPLQVSRRNLKCFIHSFGVCQDYVFSSQKEFLDQAAKWGFYLNPYNKYCKNLEEVISYCQHWQECRQALNYEVDGVVVKVNSFVLQKVLGATNKSPRWAVAYKFPAHQATTKVVAVDFGVGRTGIITPVATLKPVQCGGVTISRATLHNFDEVKRLGIKQGDTILIERAGEVIPKIIKVIVSKRTGREKEIKLPLYCPVCKGSVTKENDEEVYPIRSISCNDKKDNISNGVYWYCLNPDCPAQLKRSLLHFASRGAMDIEGLGKSAVEELVNRNLVKHISDIYNLKQENFLKLPLFKKKRADNLLNALEKSKHRPLWRFLFGLGIRHVGQKCAMVLAKRFKQIEKFSDLTVSDLEEIPEIGPIVASSIVSFFCSLKTKTLINEFKRINLNLSQGESAAKKGRLKGKTFVFTGQLIGFSRNQAKEVVERLGANWASVVSKNTDFVVAGSATGAKYKRAKQLGILILTEKDFIHLTKTK